MSRASPWVRAAVASDPGSHVLLGGSTVFLYGFVMAFQMRVDPFVLRVGIILVGYDIIVIRGIN